MSEQEFAAWKQRQEEDSGESSAVRRIIARRMERAREKNRGIWKISEAEELQEKFAEALEESMKIGGIVLDEVRQRLKSQYEYDLVGINGGAIVVGEIKRKLLPEDVRRFAKDRLPYFAADCPMVAGGRKVFGMVAGETIVPDAEKEAVDLGLFVLRLKNKKLLVENADGARPVN